MVWVSVIEPLSAKSKSKFNASEVNDTKYSESNPSLTANVPFSNTVGIHNSSCVSPGLVNPAPLFPLIVISPDSAVIISLNS